MEVRALRLVAAVGVSAELVGQPQALLPALVHRRLHHQPQAVSAHPPGLNQASGSLHRPRLTLAAELVAVVVEPDPALVAAKRRTNKKTGAQARNSRKLHCDI